MMALACPGCRRSIPADDVNIEALIAKCAGCDAVFNVSEQVDPGRTAGPRKRDAVNLPERFHLDPLPDGLVITRRWFSPVAIFLLCFCVFWDGFLVVWYVLAFAKDAPIMMKVFPLGHLAVGVGMTWLMLATLLNRTTIRATYHRISVRHGPIPWPGKRDLESADIAQLYCAKAIYTKNDRSVYHVFARLVDGRKVKLVSGLDDANAGLYVEQQLERFLGLEDQREPDEVEAA